MFALSFGQKQRPPGERDRGRRRALKARIQELTNELLRTKAGVNNERIAEIAALTAENAVLKGQRLRTAAEWAAAKVQATAQRKAKRVAMAEAHRAAEPQIAADMPTLQIESTNSNANSRHATHGSSTCKGN